MALWLSLLVAVAAMAICAAGGTIMRATGQAADLSAQAESFLRILMWGMFPLLGRSVLPIFLSTLGRPRFPPATPFLPLSANPLGTWARGREGQTLKPRSQIRTRNAFFSLKKKKTKKL